MKEEKIAYFQKRVIRKALCVRVCKCKASKRQEHDAGGEETGQGSAKPQKDSARQMAPRGPIPEGT